MQIGFYAGYVASAFTFGRFVSGYPLGQVTDAVGRKPVIIAGLLSIMVFSLTFGLSPTFGFAITTRFVECLMTSSVGLTATPGQVLTAFHILFCVPVPRNRFVSYYMTCILQTYANTSSGVEPNKPNVFDLTACPRRTGLSSD